MRILKSKDVQQMLQLSQTSLYRLYKQPDFPVFKVGGEYRVDEDELIAYLKNKNKAG